MASRVGTIKPEKITTTKILETLQQAHRQGDSTSFFYLLVAIGGKGDRIQRSSQLISGQPTSDSTDSGRDNDEDNYKPMETTDHVNTTANTSQLTTPPNEDNTALLQERREVATMEVRKTILPNVLREEGWKKVYDKDGKSTYSSLYFKKIERQQSEPEIKHNQRVGEIRVRIREKVEELQARHGVKFKVNTLLSKAILYDDQTFS